MAKYKFVGEGVGVPGLPHEISDEEAQALGVTELLQAAVENGRYQKQKAESGKHKAESRGQRAEDAATLPGEEE